MLVTSDSEEKVDFMILLLFVKVQGSERRAMGPPFICLDIVAQQPQQPLGYENPSPSFK